MAVTYNLKGTSNPYFKIGKAGATLFQGTADPSGSYTLVDGDVWFDTANGTLKFRSSSAWQGITTASDLTVSDKITLGTNKKIEFGTTDENIQGDGTSVLNINSGGAINLEGTGINIKSSQTNIANFTSQGGKLLVITNSSQNVIIETDVEDKDLIFKGNDGGSVITALTLDMSDAGSATFNKDVTVTGDLTISGTGAIQMPVGTTAQRPASPSQGMIRYNTTTSHFEGYDGSAWVHLETQYG
jgi:hypothetical protein